MRPGDEPFDYTSAVIAMLTLRANTPGGEWLSDGDFSIFETLWKEAAAADGEDTAGEYMLLEMMNAAWLAIQHLAAATGESEQVWLERIAADMHDGG